MANGETPPTNVLEPALDGPRAAMWTRFLALLRERGIKNSSARWHVIRVEEFLKACGDKDPATCTPDDVVGYLRDLGRTARLQDWQIPAGRRGPESPFRRRART